MLTSLRTEYTLRIQIEGILPTIWRLLKVTSDTKLPELHEHLQVTLGWSDYHLHAFIKGSTFYGQPDKEFDDGMKDETNVRLSSLLKSVGDKVRYEYDFGDGWQHSVELTQVSKINPDTDYPHCAGGLRACPPEDVGGVGGYYDFLESMSNSKHPQHNECKEWFGGLYDPDLFAIDQVNSSLREGTGTFDE